MDLFFHQRYLVLYHDYLLCHEVTDLVGKRNRIINIDALDQKSLRVEQ